MPLSRVFLVALRNLTPADIHW